MISLSLGEVLHVKKEHDGPVTALCINKTGSMLVTGNNISPKRNAVVRHKTFLQFLTAMISLEFYSPFISFFPKKETCYFQSLSSQFTPDVTN